MSITRMGAAILLAMVFCGPVFGQLMNTGEDNVFQDVDLSIGGSIGIWTAGPSTVNHYYPGGYGWDNNEKNATFLGKLYFLSYLTKYISLGTALIATSISYDRTDKKVSVFVPAGYFGGRLLLGDRMAIQIAVETGPVFMTYYDRDFKGISVNLDTQLQYAVNKKFALLFDTGFLAVPTSANSTGREIDFAPIFFFNAGVSYNIKVF